jgi:DNA-binding transcriptional ArsR family regulator
LTAVHGDISDFQMPADEQAHLAAESLRLLADATRIKILWALLQGESSVTCLAELVGATTTAVSQHLAKLRLAGLVRGRREGTFVYYTAADAHVRNLLAEALGHAQHTDHEGAVPPAPAGVTRPGS